MDAAVVVLSTDVEASQRAASYMGRFVAQCTHQTRLVIPDEVDAPDHVAETWGAEVTRGPLISAVNAAVSQAFEDGAELVHVLDSRVMVSANYRSVASMARVMWAGCAPVGPQLTGSQYHRVPDDTDFAASCTYLAGQHVSKLAAADVLDPEAFTVSAPAWAEVGSFDEGIEHLRWALRDWCLRVRLAGKRVVVAPGAFAYVLGGRLSPWQDSSWDARERYYRKHARPAGAEEVLTGLLIVQPQSRHQLGLLKVALASAGRVVDRILLCLVDHPMKFADGEGELLGRDSAVLQRLQPEDPGEAARALYAWARKLVNVDLDVMLVPPGWKGSRDLEASCVRAAADKGATWCLALREGDTMPGWDLAHLRRMLRHPDPLVTSYNLGVRFTWDSRRLVREDAPLYGDGGSLRDDGNGSNDPRLFRAWAGRQATDGARVANLRIVNIGLEDSRYRRPGPEQGMTLSARPADTGLSAHMLAYDGEDPDAIARWLDWTHGLVSHWVIAWTDPTESAAADHRRAARWFGAVVREVALPDGRVDFATWRNRALDQALQPDDRTEAWHVFIDPDEWVEHPIHDLMPWRRLVERTAQYAWLQRFKNHRGAGATNESAVVRMFRTSLGLRFDGRVHETLGDSLIPPQKQYGPQGVGVAPTIVHNWGTATLEDSRAKLELYHRLIREELEARPDSARHWILLGSQYAADGHPHEAWTCLDRAVASGSTTAFLTWWERGMLHLRQARGDLEQAVRRIPEGHNHHQEGQELLRSLQGVALPPARSEDAADPLPEFPDLE